MLIRKQLDITVAECPLTTFLGSTHAVDLLTW